MSVLLILICIAHSFLTSGESQSVVTGQTPWPVISDANELNTVSNAAEYVIALMNLRGIFTNPTMYDRTIVAYRCPRELNANTRYFIVMDVNEGDGSFVVMVETYQDHLMNWQPIIPSATKNFKEKPNEQGLLPVDVNFELWYAASSTNPAISSALTAAKEYLLTVYFPIGRSETADLRRLLHSEILELSTNDVILRRQSEVGQLASMIEKSKASLDAVGRNLSRTLAVRKSRILERESRQTAISKMISSNSTADDRFAESVEAWLRYEVDHNFEMKRLIQVCAQSYYKR